MKFRILTAIAAMALFSMTAMAEDDTLKVQKQPAGLQLEEDPVFQLKFDARMDAEGTIYNNSKEAGKDGDFAFQSKYLMLVANGSINKHFSYKFRYRMKAGVNSGGGFDFYHTLDWANITYSPNANWHITFGQQTVEFGGYEYDRNPMDIYFASQSWNNVRGFRPGISGKYVTNDGKHYITAQILQSDLSRSQTDLLLGYNILWSGSMGWFNTRYSVNFNEYKKGKFMNTIYLGNKLNFAWYSLELDYVNRATMDQKKFFQDFSIIGNNIFAINDMWNIFVKAGYEQNYAHDPETNAAGEITNTIYLIPGTSYYFYGLGVEFYPLARQKNNLRIHFAWSSNNGIETRDHVNLNPLGQTFTIGIRWNMKAIDRRAN